MGLFILLALILTPVIEISVFIKVGGYIGLVNTIAIVLITAVAGAALLRWQGLAVLGRAQESLRDNRFPLQEVFEGLCLVFAGALLLTPGFVTDTIGFLLFLPPVRQALKKIAVRYMADHAHVIRPDGSARRPGPSEGVIDVDFVDVTEPDAQTAEDRARIETADKNTKE
jgi:UPF0716 protein FxsA